MSKQTKRRPGKPRGMNLAQTKAWERETFDRIVQAAADEKFSQYQHRLMQIFDDAAMMAANDIFHMGPTRCGAFQQAMAGYVNEIAGMIVQDARDDPDFVYVKTKVDQRLKGICGEHFQPWEVRYGDEP